MTTTNPPKTVIAIIILATVFVALSCLAFSWAVIDTVETIFNYRVARTLERYNARYGRMK